MGVASRWAAYVRRTGGIAGVVMSPAGELADGPRVRLWYDEAWHDITSDVRADSGVSISRGRSDETQQAQPSSCSLTLSNADGRYSPRLPTSPLYGRIGRNTPIAVSVVRDGVERPRFVGEVAKWPNKSNLAQTDVTVEVSADGIMRRLGQGASPIRSAMYRDTTNPSRSDIIAYWPMEDAEGSTTAVSGLPSGAPMSVKGGPSWGSYTSYAASDALPTLGAGKLTGKPVRHTSGEYSLRFFVAIPAAGTGATRNLVTLLSNGTSRRWELDVTSGGNLVLTAFSGAGLGSSTSEAGATWGINGDQVVITLDLDDSGSDVNYTLTAQTANTSSAAGITTDTLSSTFLGYAVGRIDTVIVNDDGALTDVAIGHVALANATGALAGSDAVAGHLGETPDERALRLATEEALSVDIVTKGADADAVRMGAQSSATILELFQGLADAGDGILFEPRDQAGLALRTRMSMYNQSAAVTLSVSAGDIADVLVPVDDDQATRNDREVVRTGGSSARATLETGAMSIQPPPEGVGRGYDDSITLNLYSDRLAGHLAWWRLSKGTVDLARFPQVPVRITAETDATLAAQLLALDVGDRLAITDLPEQWPPEDLSLIIVGYSEEFDEFVHDITFVCAPEAPYRVGPYDVSRYDTAGSELAADVASGDTSLSVTTTSGPVWSPNAADWPFDIRIAGEQITVTAVAGSSSPQTLTVTRAVNGVSKVQSAGAAISLWDPAPYAL